MEYSLSSILYMLGLSGFFSSRAFLPAFLTSAVMRYGDQIPLLSKVQLIQDIAAAPGWMSHDYVFIALGILAVAELVADKVPEAQELLNLVDEYLKPIVATLTLFGVLSSEDAGYLNEQFRAGFAEGLPAFIYGAVVFWFAHLRAQVIGYLVDADDSDELGLRQLISWMEDAWVFFGFWLLLLVPIFMSILVAFALGTIWLIERHFRRQDEKSKTSCPACRHEMYLSALACPSCQAENPEPHKIGALGQSLPAQVEDRASHRLRLLEKKRCRLCATHLSKSRVEQACTACATHPFDDVATAEQYVNRLALRLPHVLGVSAVISLVPLLGLVVGVIYTRIQLIAPLKAYLPFHRNILLKIMLRLLFLALTLLQLVPLAGAAAVPLMALVSYLVYRRSFMKAVRRQSELA